MPPDAGDDGPNPTPTSGVEGISEGDPGDFIFTNGVQDPVGTPATGAAIRLRLGIVLMVFGGVMLVRSRRRFAR